MATRAKAAKKQLKATSKAKKSPARILLPSGVTDEEDKEAVVKKSPARRPKAGR